MSSGSVPFTHPRKEILRLMQLSREGDRREGILLRQNKGWFQVGALGHEALVVLGLALEPDDYMFPYYRDRAVVLGRGVENFDLALAYFAKRDSSSGGRQMPAHFSSRAHNIFSACTPTGGNLLPACGAAWAMQLEGKRSLVIASIGDAASRQGEFYEAFSFAVERNLPVVFLVEDNKYGISTPTKGMQPLSLGVIGEKHVVRVDGRSVEEVEKAAAAAYAKARNGKGPTVLWIDLDRLGSHTSSDDHRVYRPLEEIAEMSERDPIALLVKDLMDKGELTQPEWDEMRASVAKQIDEEYLRAERAQDPLGEEMHLHGLESPTQEWLAPLSATERSTMVEAFNQTLSAVLAEDSKVIVFGEDIEDPKGGVFGLTKGLSDQFPNQVFNSPLAEATIAGVGVGMAAYGFRPVFEMQFTDFIAPAWNQIVTNMSSLKWRSFGEWKCPFVLYAPYGAYLPGGSIWHSHSSEAWLTHTTGIRVAIPSRAEDVAGLLWTAAHEDEPTFLLIPKHLFRRPTSIEAVEPVPFGKARTVREGSAVTVVTWGNCVELAVEAAAAIEADAEILDLRSLVPCDYDAIVESVAKTGRLVVVHEDNLTGGFGQTIVAEMMRIPSRWDLFLSPPQVVAREDIPVGYNPIYEYAALPDVERVVAALRLALS